MVAKEHGELKMSSIKGWMRSSGKLIDWQEIDTQLGAGYDWKYVKPNHRILDMITTDKKKDGYL